MSFEKVRKIVTHPGQAHRDDFLGTCIVLAEAPSATVERRDPVTEDMADINIVVLDQGRLLDAQSNNFDHHQFPRNAEPICALSLVLKALGEYESAKDILPWLEFTEVLDAKGPIDAAAKLGIDQKRLLETLSPVESVLIHEFQKYTTLVPSDVLHELMRLIGRRSLDQLRKTSQRLRELDTRAYVWELSGLKVVDVRFVDRADQPALGLDLWCDKFHPDTAITVSQDDRGIGLCLYRRNDHPRVDFAFIGGDPLVGFAHVNGFVAKTAPITERQLAVLLERSIIALPKITEAEPTS